MSANAQFNREIDTAIELANRIVQALEARRLMAERPDFADVGDAQAHRSALHRIADALLMEGEHAPEQCWCDRDRLRAAERRNRLHATLAQVAA